MGFQLESKPLLLHTILDSLPSFSAVSFSQLSPRRRPEARFLDVDDTALVYPPDSPVELYAMVNTYGVAADSSSDPTSAGLGGESSALLGGGRDATIKRASKREGHASMVSSVSNLANTIIGSGKWRHLSGNWSVMK